MTDMDVTVRIWRAIMQNKGFFTFRRLADFLIQLFVIPITLQVRVWLDRHALGNLFQVNLTCFCNQLSCYFPILYFNIILFCKKRFRCFYVLFNLSFQRLKRRKLYLISNLMAEFHFDHLPINILRKIK